MGNHVIGEPDILIKKTKTKKITNTSKGPQYQRIEGDEQYTPFTVVWST